MRKILAASFGALALCVAGQSPAFAQFPPQGFTADPANPAIATATYTETPKGVGGAFARITFPNPTIDVTLYYDCSKKKWVVIRHYSNIPPELGYPEAWPVGGAYNSGPPPGSKFEPGDRNRAFNPTTGQNFLHHKGQWIDVKTGQVIPEPKLCPEPAGAAPQPTPQVGMVTPGPTIKLSGEVGWGGSRNGFEDFNFNGSGFVGGVSGQFNFPIGGNTYAGLSVSVLGSGISGTLPDPTTSNIRLLVPIDGILGMTFTPGGLQWPLSVYGFGGLAVGSVKVSAAPFSDTETMAGWSLGVGTDIQLTPTVSVGVKYRHFDLGNNARFNVFPGATSLVSERGDMVTGTLSYRFPISQ